ncbi:hypothetical protein MJ584_10010 [Klebsiella pneumoniae]|nr:hypothetical protein MJ584_10010 [Klebsiella pneumoniae]
MRGDAFGRKTTASNVALHRRELAYLSADELRSMPDKALGARGVWRSPITNTA